MLADPISYRVDHCAETLDHACVVAAEDFAAAADELRQKLDTSSLEDDLKESIARQWAIGDAQAVGCSLYLVAEVYGAKLAAKLGWFVLELGCDEDAVLIALSDTLCRQEEPLCTGAELLRDGAIRRRRGTSYLTKLADHYRDSCRSFLSETMLCESIRGGNDALRIRLAEHWVEFQDWASAFAALRALPQEQTTPETTYLLGRSAVALLLRAEVENAEAVLRAMPAPGPCYATLLANVWEWRVGDTAAAVAACQNKAFEHPLIARDAHALLSARAVFRPGLLPLPDDQGMLPNVLAIGMQRTASSWLWQVLGPHPDVHPLPYKETTFFNELFRGLDLYPDDERDVDISDTAQRYWEGPTRSISSYRLLYTQDHPIRMDCSPSYAELPDESVAVIRDMLGADTKVILSVRDPVERSWSNLKLDQKLVGKRASDLSFSDRISFYQSVATMRRNDFPRTLRTWRTYFDNIHVIFFDDVCSCPRRVVHEVCDFLGLSPVAIDDYLEKAYATIDIAMPHEDRAFLFGLNQQIYQECEVMLGNGALQWRRRQIEQLTR